ncbi:putative tricarboxylic transport membrane protein [Tamaricihabitans halophyticus]|uniref:Putative tricarboxylic transport membrane protein n=1 Tax=Tamaricihabitans halophyticus TaxID=1262583 RepID=A0A4R2QSQ9_9PSEU|nr:tripartite tricarboxylate transporter TctB family protein [Tamaricihabitans halophyticus]TCP50035.1 putative tricarboxylic transport membrane protein [Tamaricihabitans halophyticus]
MSTRSAQASQPGRRLARIDGELAFLVSLLALFTAYTAIATSMEWRTEAGRIGPGFFPTLIGGAGLLLGLIALARAIRRRRAAPNRTAGAPDTVPVTTEAQGSEAAVAAEGIEQRRYPGVVVLIAAALGGVLFTFIPLGALLTSMLLLFGCLSLLNRGRHAVNALLGLLVPLGLYLLFEVALNAGLPTGLLPF